MELGTAESKSLIRRKTAKVNSGEWRRTRASLFGCVCALSPLTKRGT